MRINWTVTIAACLALADTVAAQDTTAVKPRSTMSGVYTADQAARGQEVYTNQCLSCHTPDTHTGGSFLATWLGKPLSELFVYVVTTMPKSDPGILSQKEYAQVVAQLLKMNNMPTGDVELPEDSTMMRTITFDTVKVTDRIDVLAFGSNSHARKPLIGQKRR